MSTKKYLSLERLAEYDALLKAKIAQDDAATLDAAKEYADQKFDGHTHSWNDLADKPFGEGGSETVITWDGDYTTNPENYIAIDDDIINESFYTRKGVYYVSDYVPSYEELQSASLIQTRDVTRYGGIFTEEVLVENNIAQIGEDIYDVVSGYIVVARKENVEYNSVIYPKPGVYFIVIDDLDGDNRNKLFVSSLTIPGGVKTLDEIYIPDTIARKSDIAAIDLTPYETKEDAQAKLDESKAYTDEQIESHVHDWNELENKPFGEEYSFGELYRNENLAFVENGSVYASEPIQTSFVLEDGKTYRVEWDGTEYTCVCWAAPFEETKPFIVTNLGNASIAKPDFENTGEPFVMQCMQHADTADEGYSAMSIGTTSTLDTHSVVINGEGSVTKTIDEKYIPDTIARKSDLETAVDNMVNGDVVVKEAEHSTSASQDGNGNVISDTYETKDDAEAKLAEAKEYTDDLKTYVGTIPETATATDVIGYVQEKTAGIATSENLQELTNRVAQAETDIDNIQKDYLTSADKTELQTNIDTVSSAVELLTNGVDAETVDGVNDLIAYVNEHGAEVTGMKADIKANADALAELAPVAKTGSWNELADKPFGEEGTGVTIEWDGNTEGRDNFAFENGVVWYKVSDATPSVEELAEAKMTLVIDGTPMDYPLDQVMTTGEGYIGMGEIGFVVTQTPFVYNDITREAPSTGIYWQTTGEGFSASLTYGGSSSIKTLDEKFIPSSIARVSDIPVVDLTPYETKDDASAKLAEAKEYFDEKFDGHVHSWNDLEDKPFGEEGSGATIEWDGNTEGRESFTIEETGVTYYKVGDIMPSKNELLGGTMTAFISGNPTEYVLNDDVLWEGDNHLVVADLIVIAYEAGVDFGIPVSAPSTGVYFGMADGLGYATKLTYGSSSIKTLDDKFIPSSIARVSDIPVVDLTPYETKEDASAKLIEAKTYVDEKLDGHTYSWNDLEDKPFYENIVKETVIVNPIEFQASTNSMFSARQHANYGELDIGTPVEVIFDGKYYSCTVEKYTGSSSSGFSTYIGNQKLFSTNAIKDDEIQFGIKLNFTYSSGDGPYTDIYVQIPGTHTIEAFIGEHDLKCIDAKYVVGFPDIKPGQALIAKTVNADGTPKEFAGADVFSGSWDDLSNRPFYDSVIIGDEVIEHQEIAAGNNQITIKDEYMQSSPSRPIPGMPITDYVITFDGIDYNCKELSYSYATIYGNASLDTNAYPGRTEYTDNGMPFAMTYDARYKKCTLFAKDATISHTISARSAEIEFKQLDEKFIPDTIARASEIADLSQLVVIEVDETIPFASSSAIKTAIENGKIIIAKVKSPSVEEPYITTNVYMNGEDNFSIVYTLSSQECRLITWEGTVSYSGTFTNESVARKLKAWDESKSGSEEYYLSVKAMEEYVSSNAYDDTAIVERIETLETWHEGFEEITAEDINGLFA